MDSTDIRVTFPGGKRVDAQLGAHTLRTDQPAGAGGGDSAPAPFDVFLGSLATCAGYYVMAFCQARGIPTEGIGLVQRHRNDAEGHLAAITLEVQLPAGFPEKYRDAVVRAADGCKVKKLLAHPPEITTVAAMPAALAQLA